MTTTTEPLTADDVDTMLDIQVDLDAALPCIVPDCPNPGVWLNTVYHPTGGRCGVGTMCDPHKTEVCAFIAMGHVPTCTPHRITHCTCTWRRL